MHTIKIRRFLSAFFACVLLSGCSSGPVANKSEELLIQNVSSFEEATPVSELIKEGDQVVRAVLKEVTAQHRLLNTGLESDNPEHTDYAEERLGLVFEILEVYAGATKPGETVVIEAVGGFQVLTETSERQTELRINGIGPKDWLVGTEYLFFYTVDQDLGPRFRSTGLMAAVGTSGELRPLASQNTHPEFSGAKTLEQARTVITQAVAN